MSEGTNKRRFQEPTPALVNIVPTETMTATTRNSQDSASTAKYHMHATRSQVNFPASPVAPGDAAPTLSRDLKSIGWAVPCPLGELGRAAGFQNWT